MPTWAQGGIDTVRNGGISSDCVRPTHEITVDRHVFRDFCIANRITVPIRLIMPPV